MSTETKRQTDAKQTPSAENTEPKRETDLKHGSIESASKSEIKAVEEGSW